MSSLQVKPVNLDTPIAEQVDSLYTDAFPRVDKFAFDGMCRFAKENDGVDFNAYFDGETFCGFSFTLLSDSYLFVLYLATVEKLRSQGYGTRILQYLEERNPGKVVVLDIELPHPEAKNAEQPQRRRAFYERNGFWCTGDVFGVEDNLYLLLTTGESWDCAAFLAEALDAYGNLADYYFGEIYHFDDEVRKPA